MRGVEAGLVLVLGCGLLPAPGHPVPSDREVVEGQAHGARVLWAMMEVCTGAREPIDRWRWYVVKGGPWQVPDGRIVNGYAQSMWRRIYLADDQASDPTLIAHEILHALGVPDGSPVLAACGARP